MFLQFIYFITHVGVKIERGCEKRERGEEGWAREKEISRGRRLRGVTWQFYKPTCFLKSIYFISHIGLRIERGMLEEREGGGSVSERDIVREIMGGGGDGGTEEWYENLKYLII